MASVPNRVYPLNEYTLIYADTINVQNAKADKFTFDTTYGTIPSGAMTTNDIVLYTGAAASSGLPVIYIRYLSGSTACVASISPVYVSKAA